MIEAAVAASSAIGADAVCALLADVGAFPLDEPGAAVEIRVERLRDRRPRLRTRYEPPTRVFG